MRGGRLSVANTKVPTSQLIWERRVDKNCQIGERYKFYRKQKKGGGVQRKVDVKGLVLNHRESLRGIS